MGEQPLDIHLCRRGSRVASFRAIVDPNDGQAMQSLLLGAMARERRDGPEQAFKYTLEVQDTNGRRMFTYAAPVPPPS